MSYMYVVRTYTLHSTLSASCNTLQPVTTSLRLRSEEKVSLVDTPYTLHPFDCKPTHRRNMKPWITSLCLAFAMSCLSFAFVPHATASPKKTLLNMAFVPPLPVQHILAHTSHGPGTQDNSPLAEGIQKFNAGSTQMLSLQERRPPTKEEIEAKKRNFNMWFWGGGFVAPFLATFYYFGFKFWER